MKKNCLLTVSVLLAGAAFGQTNTFPSSGNVGVGTVSPLASLHVNGTIRSNNNIKVFATDDAWSEGLLIVKPFGWSGIHIARNDPATGNYEGNWALGYTGNTGNDFSISNSTGGIQHDHSFFISASTRNVGIGTANPTSKLAVNGTIRAKEIKVENANWPDYVFHRNYALPSLQFTESFIRLNGHLPGIPTAAEVAANGVSLGELNAKLLEKIEELTLHLIALKKEGDARNEKLLAEIAELKLKQN